MAGRATKSGFAAEAQAKLNAKYDVEYATKVMSWVRDRTASSPGCSVNADGSQDNVHETLKSGFVLCSLMQALGIPIKKFKEEKMAFKQMEAISTFLTSAEQYGVDRAEVFQTVDLFERQNLGQVILCLGSLARKVEAKNPGMGFGPKEAERNSRNFTEEQMKAGQGVIGLQMGTNKGASQAGQNFGKARMIMD